ncbi:MAG: sirohydrochlorin cobaltochelatase [Desulfovibrionaceae bacterium]|nr:sirohydrochlorin cobaltochelatase [Desulfovibrionaceae bacterium]
MRKGILLVAYGAVTSQGRRVLVSIDERVRASFPGFSVRWAYSSPAIRTRLAKSGLKSDSVIKALERLWFEHFEHVVIQPLQTIAGVEHEEMLKAIASVVDKKNLSVYVGQPLLADASDISKVAESLLKHLPPERLADEDVIFMGHGSKHPAAQMYAELHKQVQALDNHVHVGTMSGMIDLDFLLPNLTSERVWLMPFLSTVGRHTLNDMAGTNNSSWRSCLEEQGHICLPVLKGTAEYAAIVDIWLEHLRLAAMPLT